MKRIISLALALVLVLSVSSVLAAGELKITQENYYTIDSYGTAYGYIFAKVENVGDKSIMVDSGLLEINDADGALLTSTDYLDTYLTYLEPGQYTYVSASPKIEAGVDAVADHVLTVAGKSEYKAMVQLPHEASYAANVQTGYWASNFIYVTYTNNTDHPLYDVSVVMALLDAEGNILYMDDDRLYDDRALMPGSSMTIRKDVSSSFIEYFEANNLTPVSVDALVFAEAEQQ